MTEIMTTMIENMEAMRLRLEDHEYNAEGTAATEDAAEDAPEVVEVVGQSWWTYPSAEMQRWTILLHPWQLCAR